MKLIEEKIKQKYREQEKKKSIGLKHQNNIKNVQLNISNIQKAKTLECKKKSKKINEIKHLKENFNESFLYKIVKIITFGLVNQKKIHLNKIKNIHSIINDIDSKIVDLENKIIVEENNITIEENNLNIINKNIVNLSNEIKALENEFLNKLFKFRDKLIEVQSKIVKYSNIRYIDNLKRIEFKTFVDNSIGENKKYILHEKIKSSLIEIIDFKNNTSNWTKKKNKLFISNEKKKEKSFFDTIESNPLTVKQTEAVLINEQHNLILAGAGSGKTSVVVAKVCYMLSKDIVKANEILILAFNKKAQEELVERFKNKNINVEIKTFHSFGLNVIGKSSGEKPDICRMSESSNNMNVFIENTIRELLEKNTNFRNNFLIFVAYFKIPFKDENEFENLGKYYEYQDNFDMKTLKQQLIDKQNKQSKERITFKKETVKGYQELIIANFFTLNGIEYSYEEPYRYNTATQNYRQYKPDFYLPDYDIYIEHFGIDRQGNTAPYIDREKYLDGIEWKVNLHKENNTTLVQTFSYEFNEDHLLDSLRKKLEKYNVRFRELSVDEVLKLLNASIEDKQFTKLFTSFLNHFKSNRHNIAKLKKEAKSDKRNMLFLEVFEGIYNKYIEYQKRYNCIDFDDMILQALEYIETNNYKNKYKHVFIDEFQDISTTRFNFIKELISQNNSFLTVVGDDWQSINRFAGSNIEIIQKFNETFKYTETIALDYSFRFDNHVSHVASNFIQKNPYQLKKNIKTIKEQKHNKFSICVYWNSSDASKDENTINDVRSILNLIVQKEGNNNKEVKILARYKFDLKSLNNINNLYPTLKIDTMSVHGSKGLEADYVIVLNVSSGSKFSFPSRIEDDPILNIVATGEDDFDDAEERRLFYVALTRTKGAIFLMGDMYHKSIFIEEILKDYEDKIYFLNDPKVKLTKCPKCKIGFLKKRSQNNNKDKFFYGCSNYPRCEYTERVHYCPECATEMYKDIDKNISKCKSEECDFESILCKECNDYMIERNGQYGKFIGCMSFPHCKYTQRSSD